jgi:Flp pilus assembly protein TadB
VSTAAILLLVLVGAIVGGGLVIGAPIFALPIIFVVLGALGALYLTRRGREAREIREFREQATESEAEFSSRDRLTQS